MKNNIVIYLFAFFLFYFLSGCKNKSDENVDSQSDKSTKIKNKTLRDKTFYEFLFVYNGSINDNITGDVNDVFKENIVQQKIDTSRSGAVNLKSMQEVLYEYKFGEPTEEGAQQITINYSMGGRIEKKSFPLNAGKKYVESEINYEYNSLSRIKNISSKNSSKEELYSFSFIYDSLTQRMKNEVCKFRNNRTYIESQTGGFSYTQYHKLFRYNDLGLVKEEIKWSVSGDLEEKIFFNYDTEGNLTDYSLYSYDNIVKKVIKRTQINLYDKEIEVIDVDKNHNPSRKNIYIYDSLYKLIEIKFINASGKIAQQIFYNYDGDKLTETRLVKEDTTQNRKIVNRYNDKNKIVERILYDGSNNIALKLKRTYDGIGNLIDELIISGFDEMVNKYTYKYDARNLLVEKIQYDYLIEPRKMWKYNYAFF